MGEQKLWVSIQVFHCIDTEVLIFSRPSSHVFDFGKEQLGFPFSYFYFLVLSELGLLISSLFPYQSRVTASINNRCKPPGSRVF